MNAFDWHAKKNLIAAACAVLVLAAAGTAVSAKRQQADFDPSKYANSDQMSESSVEFDSNVFGSNKNKSDGLEMDHTQPDDYNLTDGKENIRDEQETTQTELAVTNGSSNQGDAPIVPGTVSNDGTGADVIGAGGNGVAGGEGGQGDGGTGGGTTSPDTDSGSESGGGDAGSGSDTGTGTTTPSTSDDDKYGTDYSTPEIVESEYPVKPEEDLDELNQPITATSLSVTGSLKQHFYPGESPRPSEMKKYITVSATMSNGTTRTGLQYCQDVAYGGDYTVTWDTGAGAAGGSVGGKTGTYTATLSYRGESVTLKYDIVTWQVTLYDFDESQVPGFKPLVQTATPGSTPIVDLTDAMTAMDNAILLRSKGEGYLHTNVVNDYGFLCYTQYFGGWSVERDGTAVGLGYKMPRPNSDNIVGGVYNIDLYPVWAKMNQNNDGYYVVKNRSGDTALIGYNPDEAAEAGFDPTVIQVPEGVVEVDLMALSQNGATFDGNLTEVTTIVLPETVSKVVPLEIERGTPFPSLTAFQVASANQFFMGVDGVLYNKTGKKLVCYPEGKTSVAEWSDRVEAIGDYAFACVGQGNSWWDDDGEWHDIPLAALHIPATVTEVGEMAFANACIDTLEFLTERQMEWGPDLFYNSTSKTFQNLILHTQSVPTLPEGKEAGCFAFADYLSILDGAYDSISITVPDSKNDACYLAYLTLLTRYVDGGIVADSDGCVGYRMLKTPGNAKSQYSCDAYANILTADGTTLLQAVQGKTVANVSAGVQNIAAGAFAGLDDLEIIIFQGENPPKIDENAFEGTIPTGLSIYVSSKDTYAQELAFLTDKYQAVIYGDGADAFVVKGSVYVHNDSEDLSKVTLLSWNKSAVYANVGSFYNDSWEKMFVTKVADGAFAGCTKLGGVTFSAEVKELGSNLFAADGPLKIIAFNGATPPVMKENSLSGVTARLYVPLGMQEEYTTLGSEAIAASDSYQISDYGDITVLIGTTTATDGTVDDWGDPLQTRSMLHYVAGTGNLTLGYYDDTAAIADGAFEGCTDITGLSASSQSLWEIGERAFAGCTSLSTVDLATIPDCGEDAFADCLLESVELGDPGYELNDPLSTDSISAFQNTVFLGLRYSMTELKGSFAEWSNLTTFSANYMQRSSWTRIGKLGDGLFKDCDKISLFSFADIPGEYGTDALAGCTDFDLIIGDSRLNFGDLTTGDLGAFKNARSLTFSGEAATLSGSFADWTHLEMFYAESAIDYVYGSFDSEWNDVGLFERCPALSLAEFDDVAELGNRTFANCKKLEKVILNSSQSAVIVPADTFDGCSEDMIILVNYKPYTAPAQAEDTAEVSLEEAQEDTMTGENDPETVDEIVPEEPTTGEIAEEHQEITENSPSGGENLATTPPDTASDVTNSDEEDT